MELLDRMEGQKLDYTNTFRSISNKHNPAIIPRNHHVEEALTAAEQGNLSVMNDLLTALSKPYEDSDKSKVYSQPVPATNCNYKTYCGT